MQKPFRWIVYWEKRVCLGDSNSLESSFIQNKEDWLVRVEPPVRVPTPPEDGVGSRSIEILAISTVTFG